MNIAHEAGRAAPYVVAMRRYFHEHPELPNQEDATLRRVGEELKRMGIPWEEIPGGGLMGFLQGTHPGKGKTVLLRADVDALPVQENPHNLAQPRVCISQTPGVMHACGHDGHTAILLGAAKILSEHREQVAGQVLLLFERGEERGSGIPQVLAYLDQRGIQADTCYGTHLVSILDTGKIALNEGYTMSTEMCFRLTIHGKNGHVARPDLANSPIDCFAALYSALQNYRLTQVSPFQVFTFAVGQLQAGTIANTIPDSLFFAGSARVFDRERVGVPFRRYLETTAQEIAAAHGCTLEYNSLSGPAFPVYNDPPCTRFARQVIGEAVGRQAVCTSEPWMASEDFSCLQALYPGVFAFVGIRNPQKGTGADHHNEYFDLDEEALPLAVSGTVAYTLGFLQGKIDTAPRRWTRGIPALLGEIGYGEKAVREIYQRVASAQRVL